MAKAEQCGSYIKLPTSHFQLFTRGLRSPLYTAAVSSFNLASFLSSFCFHNSFNCPCPHLSFSPSVLELHPNSDPPEPGGPSLTALSPEILGFSPRQWGSIFPDYRLVLSQAPDVTRIWQTAGSQEKIAADNAVLCGKHNTRRGFDGRGDDRTVYRREKVVKRLQRSEEGRSDRHKDRAGLQSFNANQSCTQNHQVSTPNWPVGSEIMLSTMLKGFGIEKCSRRFLGVEHLPGCCFPTSRLLHQAA